MMSQLWLLSGPSPTAWKCAVVTVNPLAVAAVVPAAPTGAAINTVAPRAINTRFTYSHPHDVGPTPTAPHDTARRARRQYHAASGARTFSRARRPCRVLFQFGSADGVDLPERMQLHPAVVDIQDIGTGGADVAADGGPGDRRRHPGAGRDRVLLRHGQLADRFQHQVTVLAADVGAVDEVGVGRVEL